ncbi:MAG: tetratricopeptide repeat protein [Methanomicrobiales archaeon]|nr:tetratricopeptide repeat protein [Methanomicrobiales archaeon]MDI6877640.1 tetratricopeptide repeat protein [Methanomicrobiales archaeon]
MGFLDSIRGMFGTRAEPQPAASVPEAVPPVQPKRAFLNGRGIDSWNNVGRLYQKQGLHEKAIQEYDRILAADPKDREVLAWKAESLRRLGKVKEAEAAEQQAKTLQ